MADTSDESEPSGTGVLSSAAALADRFIRAQMRLSGFEVPKVAPETRRAVAHVAIGALAVLYGIGFLTTATYLGLSHFVWPWLAALIVGGVLSIAGGLTARKGVQRLKRAGFPARRTKRTHAG